MNVLALYQNLSRWPVGKRLFSWFFCFKAPYFGTIRPYFEELAAGRCVVRIKKRRAVLNHLGTVHAIAICNMAEAAGGLCVEASLPRNMRWIPAGMTVKYLKKASTDLVAVCELNPQSLIAGENLVEVNVTDLTGQNVLHALITMHISEKKKLPA
jgi:acyl-coenzyme A thioesterase PaaI-like protein